MMSLFTNSRAINSYRLKRSGVVRLDYFHRSQVGPGWTTTTLSLTGWSWLGSVKFYTEMMQFVLKRNTMAQLGKIRVRCQFIPLGEDWVI